MNLGSLPLCDSLGAIFGKDYLGGIYGGIPILKDFSFKEEN